MKDRFFSAVVTVTTIVLIIFSILIGVLFCEVERLQQRIDVIVEAVNLANNCQDVFLKKFCFKKGRI